MSATPDDPHRSLPQDSDDAPDEQSRGDSDSIRDLEQAIAVLSTRVEEEFRIAERLDSKQRQAFALASVFFAVVQTVAFGGFAQGQLHATQRGIIGIVAALAGVALIVVMHQVNNAEELRIEDDISPEAIVAWCEEADAPGYVAVRLVRELSEVALRRTKSNRSRTHNYDKVALAARWSLIATGAELLVAIALRI